MLAILAAITTLTVTTATTARPPSTPSPLDPDDFRPLVMADTTTGSALPFPSIEYGTPASPVPIGDFQEQVRSFEPRATPNQPVNADSLLKPTPKPSHSRSGTASWYCKAGVSDCHYKYSGGLYAAAGPGLRIGDWRGRKVKVCSSGECVHVTLIDWCACGSGRLIDLYSDAFRRIAPLSSGTTSVTVYWW